MLSLNTYLKRSPELKHSMRVYFFPNNFQQLFSGRSEVDYIGIVII